MLGHNYDVQITVLAGDGQYGRLHKRWVSTARVGSNRNSFSWNDDIVDTNILIGGPRDQVRLYVVSDPPFLDVIQARRSRTEKPYAPLDSFEMLTH